MSSKFWLLVVVLIAVNLVSVFYSWTKVSSLEGEFEQLHKNRLMSIIELNKATRSAYEVNLALSATFNSPTEDNDKLNDRIYQINEHFQALGKSFSKFETYLPKEQNKVVQEYVTFFKNNYNELISVLNEVESLLRVYNFDEVKEVHSSVFQFSFAEIDRSLRQLVVLVTIGTDNEYIRSIKSIKQIKAVSLAMSLVIIVFLILMVSYSLRKIVILPLRRISDMLGRMAKGELPRNLDVNSIDELGQMTQIVNVVNEGLKRTASFAKEIGEGNISTQFVPLSDKDVLGSALLGMQESLSKAAEEEKTRKEDDQRRNWITQGVAKFGEILRQDNDNIVQLSDNILKNLVEYLGVNQGGLFIVNDDDDVQAVLELLATYAFSQKKNIERKIDLGEGLVGTCAIEKKTVYLTEIPQEYIELTSGLGSANPDYLLIVPLKIDDTVFGVLELASFNEFPKFQVEFVERIGESIASTLQTVKINERTSLLLEQSKKQAEEMAVQEEEMRQNMEELKATQEASAHKEEQLKEMVDRFRLSSLATSDGLWELNVPINGVFDDTTEIYYSNRFLEILGYTPEEFPSVMGSLMGKIHPEERREFSESLRGYIFEGLGKDKYDKTTRMRHKMGDFRNVQILGVTMRDEHENSIRVAGSIRDVTEEYRQKQKIEQLIEHFELSIKATAGGLWEVAIPKNQRLSENSEFYWSDDFCRILGVDASSFGKEFKDWTDCMDKKDREIFLDEFYKFAYVDTEKDAFDITVKLGNSGTNMVWTHVVAATIRDTSGNPVRIAGSIVDVTENKLQEIEIKNSTQELIKQQADVEKFNEALRKNELELKNALDLAKETEAELTRKNYELESQEEEMRQNMDMLKMIQESIEQSQQVHQQIIDGMPSAVFWKDKELGYLGCNKAFALHAGLRSPEDIVGMTDADMPWQDQEDIKEQDLMVVESGMPIYNLEEQQKTSQGLMWMSKTKVPLFDEFGQIFGVLGVYWDITDRIEERQQLEQQVKELQEKLNNQ